MPTAPSAAMGVSVLDGANSVGHKALDSRRSVMNGSNWVARQRMSSALTCASVSGRLYGRSVVIASIVSANRMMRDASGIASPASPVGIAGAVPILMMMPNGRDNVRSSSSSQQISRHRPGDPALSPTPRVLACPVLRDRSILLMNLSDIVQQSRPADPRSPVFPTVRSRVRSLSRYCCTRRE